MMSLVNERKCNLAHIKPKAIMTIEDSVTPIEMADGTFKAKIFFKDTGEHILFGKLPTWEEAINSGIVEMDRLIEIRNAAQIENLSKFKASYLLTE